jgi:hypothetical protein
MCRIAALYLTEGYYFNLNMEVVKVMLVTVDARPKPDDQSFSQPFLASDPKNRIL